jgi:hypothetical protein
LPPLKEQARTCSGCRLMVGRQFVSSTSFLITPPLGSRRQLFDLLGATAGWNVRDEGGDAQ